MTTANSIEQTAEVVAHERTYKAFNILLRWSIVILGDLVLSLVLWFAAGVGFLGAFAVGVVVFALGYWFVIRHEEHQPLDVWAEGR